MGRQRSSTLLYSVIIIVGLFLFALFYVTMGNQNQVAGSQTDSTNVKSTHLSQPTPEPKIVYVPQPTPEPKIIYVPQPTPEPKIVYIPANCTETTSQTTAQKPKIEITDEQAYAAITKLIPTILSGGTGNCKFKDYGGSWGAHSLCEVTPNANCKFFSFGISTEYSFDKDLSQSARCKGIGFDPTINHNSKLDNEVWFLAMGANSLDRTPDSWIMTSVPGAMKWLKWPHLDVLKMDCEGCEYAIARDILEEDPDFFEKVDQAAYEFHVSKVWINTEQHIINMGKLFYLMDKAGFELITSVINPCSEKDETPGCMPKLIELGYPCGMKKMCQNFLFAKTKIFGGQV